MEKYSIAENPSDTKKENDLTAEQLLVRYENLTKDLMAEFSMEDSLSRSIEMPFQSGIISGLNLFMETYGHQEYHNGQLKGCAGRLGLRFKNDKGEGKSKPQSLITHYGDIKC